MPREHALAPALPHAHDDGVGRCQAILEGLLQRIDVARRHEPPVLARADELGDAGDEGADHRAPQRHRFHDDDGQAFREARQHKRTRGEDLVAHAAAVDPAGDSTRRRRGPATRPVSRSAGRISPSPASTNCIRTPLPTMRAMASSSNSWPFCSQILPTQTSRGRRRRHDRRGAHGRRASTPQWTTWILGHASMVGPAIQLAAPV